MKNRLFMLGQYLLPHHALSRITGHLAQCKMPWFKNRLISWFIARYDVDMSMFVGDRAEDFEHFNAFFTRELKPGARSLPPSPKQVGSPADGSVSQIGKICDGRLLQAKGHYFSLLELLGGHPDHAAAFHNGSFATVYLSPRDYHRVHMPLAGTLREMIHIPGQLFSVNPLTAARVPGLFARNERIVCLFDTANGPMAVVLVGAMIVASIETTWAGLVSPPGRKATTFRYSREAHSGVFLNQGAELGRFRLGSTVIVLFGPGSIERCETWQVGQSIQVGQPLFQLCQSEPVDTLSH